ncbi:MAG: HNH endonuclease [Labilithrix sp.]|nr:HNH endonuclease [Labilithrix sp.]
MQGRRLVAKLIAYLIEIEERRLHLERACPSLFDFCRRRLGMSEGEAYRRITAARLVKRCPSLLAHIDRGDITLSTVVLLRDHLTEATVAELVDATRGKTKREVEELLARRAPRPDVPAKIRKLPERVVTNEPGANAGPSASVGTRTSAAPDVATANAGSHQAPPHEAAPPRPRLEPLSPSRHKLQMTISTEVREKLERARDLMRHRNPSGDLAVVLESALDALLVKLEKERLAKTSRPRREPSVPAAPTAASREKTGVARAVRREVFARDGEQCTYVDGQGRRCPSRAFLELDHVEARALGGTNAAANLRVRCRSHNQLHAEQVFGKAHVAREIHLRQRMYQARRGLANLGFPRRDTQRVLETIFSRHAERDVLTLEEVLREAIALLTG